MAASVDNISDLRRMVAEPSTTPYSDAILTRYIEAYPVMDTDGRESGDDGWTAGYDLNAAAADIWSEKAAAVQMYYSFSADGGKYNQSQLYESAMDKSRYHAARRRASSRHTHKSPNEDVATIDDNSLIYDESYAWWRP